jgi:excisionase family DNA binding protein
MFLTVEECATTLRVSPRTVRRMGNRGELLLVRLGDGKNRPVRVFAPSLREFLRRRLRAAGVTPSDE